VATLHMGTPVTADAVRGAQYDPPRATHQEAIGIALTELVTP
jgi:hypothetical protein